MSTTTPNAKHVKRLLASAERQEAAGHHVAAARLRGRASGQNKPAMCTDVAERPSCSVAHHGYMDLRAKAHTAEQEFCGTWYDCADARCPNSVLLPSPELMAQLDAQR